MGRLTYCMLAMFMLFLLVSCGVNTMSSPMESKTAADTSTENAETVPPSVDSSQPTPQDSETGQTPQVKDVDNASEIRLNIVTNDTILTATMEDNSSAKALLELLKDNPLTINMSDYGNMEKVGDLGTNLPRNDEQITTGPGDLVLFQGNIFVIYYAPNSWNFTRLGKIDGITKDEIIDILGSGDVTVTLSI